MTIIKTVASSPLKEAYHQVMDRVAQTAGRCNRRLQDIIVVAVTKTASPDQIRTLVEMGHGDLGENRIQQLTQRVVQLEEFLSRKRSLGRTTNEVTEVIPHIRWHMIGHLQRNKVKQVLGLVKLIHSVDSLRLVEEIQNTAARSEQVVDILLEVNASGDPAKQGVAAPAAAHLAEQIDTMLNIRLRGLMTMASLVENPQDARPTFARAAEIYHDICDGGACGKNFNILSMGMTNDFEIAIEEGANVLRIGRALFGDG